MTTTHTTRKVTTRENYKPYPGTTVEGKSETVQNEAPTIAEMFKRLIANQPIDEKEGSWGEEEPDIEDMDLQEYANADLAEREQIVQDLKHRIANLETQWKLEEELKKQEAEAKKVDQKKTEDQNKPENLSGLSTI